MFHIFHVPFYCEMMSQFRGSVSALEQTVLACDGGSKAPNCLCDQHFDLWIFGKA